MVKVTMTNKGSVWVSSFFVFLFSKLEFKLGWVWVMLTGLGYVHWAFV